jgi:predicted nicotinamide N-methyase
MTRKKTVLVAGVGALVAMQLVRFERTNPKVTGEIDAPSDVKSVLRRACYDCHSNETVWPWYSQLAPVSWLLHRDVVAGRKHLNFSEWSSLAADKQAKKRRGVGEQVAEGEMPPWFYTPAHPNAKLSPEDAKLLEDWANGAAGR